LISRIASLGASEVNQGIVGPLLDAQKMRISELEDSTIEARKVNADLEAENTKLREENESGSKIHAEEVHGLRESVETLKAYLQMKSSEENTVLSSCLAETRATSEKLSSTNSSLERRIHACELVIGRNLELIASKDQMIDELKQHLQEASKAFTSKVSSLDDELRLKLFEIESANLQTARLEAKILNLQRDLEDLRRERKLFGSCVNELQTYKSEVCHLRRENQRLKTLNLQILNRGISA